MASTWSVSAPDRRQRWRQRLGALLAVSAALAAGSLASRASSWAAPHRAPALQAACEALTGLEIPARAIGLPTNGAIVTAATMVAASPQTTNADGTIQLPLPERCQVLGAIAPVDSTAPPIQFQVNLPREWNGRAMHYGGGGFNGVLVTGLAIRYPARPNDPLPITRGYVTFGSDSGHTGNNGEFALNDEALRNFGFEQLKKTKDVAFAIVERYYGRPPRQSYFYGHSNGGREALMVVQRFPADYDGVLAVAPVLNWTAKHIHANALNTALIDGGWMSAAKVALLTQSTLDACDALDGLTDGIISRYGRACQHDASALRCPSGGDEGDWCLSDAQLAFVRLYRERWTLPFPVANGIQGYAGYGAPGGESLPDGWDRWQMGTAAPTWPHAPGAAFQPGVGTIPAYGQTFVRFFIGQDPRFDTYRFDPAPYRERIAWLSTLLDATDPDISAFIERGGKLILKVNTADSAQSAMTAMEYYEAVVATLGRQRVDAAVRLYVSPGASHFGLNAPSQVDLVPVLESWVEQGQPPPDDLVQVQMDPRTFEVLRSRPLCRYPLSPRYNGTGSPDEAASFTCVP